MAACRTCLSPSCRGCPTPAEIAERAAEIRREWTEAEHRQRYGLSPLPEAVEPARLRLSELECH